MTVIRLDIGSGGPSLLGPGWLGVDAHADGADVAAPMWALPYERGAVAAIHSSHALEHVPMDMVAPTLQEWARVLCDGGALTLLVPDLDYVCQYWLSHPGEPWALMMLFGSQERPGQFHATGWNAVTLRRAVEGAGFFVTGLESVWSHQQSTLRLEATRR
jgi:hypothetical protein